jgi:hypothetical protein
MKTKDFFELLKKRVTNVRGVFFLLMLGFVSVNVFSDNALLNEIREIIRDELRPPQYNLVPLTLNIIKENNLNEEQLRRLGYYLSTDITLTSRPNSTSQVTSSGVLQQNTGNRLEIITIPRTSMGELEGDFDEESLLIKFPEQDIKILFVRNKQTGRFDVDRIDGSPINFQVTTKPFLCIKMEQRGALVSQTNIRQSVNQNINLPHISHNVQFPDQILGNGKLNRDIVVSYILSKGSTIPRQEVNALIEAYIREAQVEGVNHDIAIAQMIYATGFLNNRHLLNTHNYGGLNTDMGISVIHGNRHPNMTEGVMAHIQHLKGYASRELPRQVVVNRRYFLLISSGILGTVTTLEGLFAIWSPHNPQRYGNEITRILRELYLFPVTLIF